MKRFLRGLSALSAVSALAALSALLATPARAQSLRDPNQWIIKAGVSVPSEGLPRTLKRTWWAGGLEYQAGNPNGRAVKSLEMLYTSAKDDVSQEGAEDFAAKFQMLSIMLNYRFRGVGPEDPPLGNVFFYGAGLGAHIIWADINDPNNPGGYGVRDSKATFAGANLFVGYEFAANFELQAKYQIVFGKVADESLNTLQLLAGVKF